MTSTRSVDPSSTNIVHQGNAGAGPFMVTLCRLVEPVSIRPPESPHLKPFTFFTSRAPRTDGADQLYLHMGFFGTLAYAEKWARAVRGRHPDAIATAAPRKFWQPPAGAERMTDTQVLNILETRRYVPRHSDADVQNSEQIELLRPDDTGVRRALKEAVVSGAPVHFAVQLYWSVRPIDPSRVPALDIFNAYTLYSVETRRANRSCYFLRLGFFGDPVSAKLVAFHVRSTFVSAAVVPVLDEEIARARAAEADAASIPCFVQQHLEHGIDSSGTAAWATEPSPENDPRRTALQGAETLEQTLAQLAERELWSDPDTLSDTGVRHLKVEMEKRKPGRKH
jgi:nucleotide-binding universal stress UspA family protein